MSNPSISAATRKAIDLLRERDAISLTKYHGKTMDRPDLTAREWCRHFIEELADGIKYGIRMEDAFLLLEEARSLIGRVEYCPLGEEWIRRYDEKFGGASAPSTTVKELPDEPGFWWWRQKGKTEWEMVSVRSIYGDDLHAYSCEKSWAGWNLEVAPERFAGEWSKCDIPSPPTA
jgi:hypothetical protein